MTISSSDTDDTPHTSSDTDLVSEHCCYSLDNSCQTLVSTMASCIEKISKEISAMRGLTEALSQKGAVENDALQGAPTSKV